MVVNFSGRSMPAAIAFSAMIRETLMKWSVIGAQIFFVAHQARFTIYGWYSWKTRLCSEWTMIGVPASRAAIRPSTPALEEWVWAMWYRPLRRCSERLTNAVKSDSLLMLGQTSGKHP